MLSTSFYCKKFLYAYVLRKMNNINNSFGEINPTTSVTNVENENSEAMVLPEYTATISLVFLTSILAVGVLGNLLVIIVILTSKETGGAREGRSTNLFLLNLSIADLLVLVTCTPSALVEIATRGDAWILGKVIFNTSLCYGLKISYFIIYYMIYLIII